MIRRLDVKSRQGATVAHRILHDAYMLEASLLGVDDFPPLRRTVEDFMVSANQFLADYREGAACGILEYLIVDEGSTNSTMISSLGVAPVAHRQGIGRALVEHVLNESSGSVIVSTAQGNHPAIGLYESMGFKVRREFVPAHGIPLVELELRATT